MSQWILLDSFPNETEAEIARCALEAAGIPCLLRLNPIGDALLGAVGVRTGPMDLFVENDKKSRATSILSPKK